MHRKLPGYIIVVYFAIACHSSQTKKETSNYFPVEAFLEGQVHQVDSLRLPVTKFTITNSKTDSALISAAEFKNLAAHFITTDISDSTLGKYYTEKSFADQTIASVTLTYSTVNKALPLQRLDVIIHADPVQNDQVKTIYMERNYHDHDTAILEKLYWRANRNFQVITIKQTGTLTSETSVIKVVWNSSD